MSITIDNFDIAISRLYDTWQELEEQSDWRQVQILTSFGTSYLRVIKQLPEDDVHDNSHRSSSDAEAEVALDDYDDEALPIQQPSTSTPPQVIYDIIHSTSYQVPVLYITFKDLSKAALPSLDEVYERLIPAVHKSQVESVGVMGALSMAEHPITGVPAYFIHPCRTQEAMAPLIAGQVIEPERYLLLWLGLDGGSVGLNVPVEMAQAMSGSSCS